LSLAGRDYRDRSTTLEHGERTETHPGHLFVNLAAETYAGPSPITAGMCRIICISDLSVVFSLGGALGDDVWCH
jgi:hypothetical protein